MVEAVLKLVGFDLQRQLARLKAQAEELKDRTIDDIKRKAIDTGLVIGFALGGLVFVFLTLIVGLIALYLWVAASHGPFVALGAVALTTTLIAALMFVVATTRADSKKPESKEPLLPAEASRASAELPRAAAAPSANQAFTSPVQAAASLANTLTQDLTDRAHSVANEAMDSAVEVIRKSPRETLLAAVAVAVVAGVLIGRRK